MTKKKLYTGCSTIERFVFSAESSGYALSKTSGFVLYFTVRNYQRLSTRKHLQNDKEGQDWMRAKRETVLFNLNAIILFYYILSCS